jgi:predicted RNA-binding protein with PIN domain
MNIIKAELFDSVFIKIIMIFIIDANNLAGQLGLLNQKNFDRELITIIKVYLEKRKIKIFLVFDGRDNMGDKFEEGYLTIIYTPRDSYYKSADDKIIELVINLKPGVKDEVRVITDDREIIQEVEKIAGNNIKIKILKASDFADKLKSSRKEFIEDEGDDKNLNDKEIEKINNELLDIWK